MKRFIKYWFFDLEEEEPIDWKTLIPMSLFMLIACVEVI